MFGGPSIRVKRNGSVEDMSFSRFARCEVGSKDWAVVYAVELLTDYVTFVGNGESKAKYVLLDGKRLEKSIRNYV